MTPESFQVWRLKFLGELEEQKRAKATVVGSKRANGRELFMRSDAEELVRSDLELLASAGDLDPDHTDLLHNLPEPPPEEAAAEFDESLFADLELDDDDDVLNDPDYEPPHSPPSEPTNPAAAAASSKSAAAPAPSQKATQKPSAPAATQSREEFKSKQAGGNSKK